MVNSMQAKAQPKRSLEKASAKKKSLGEGWLWQIIIKLLQVFHILHSLPFRYVSYRPTLETPIERKRKRKPICETLETLETPETPETLETLETPETPETLETPETPLARLRVHHPDTHFVSVIRVRSSTC
ncbi:MAG: hypothetical protein ACI30R_10345 [Sodaliphilus sp.]